MTAKTYSRMVAVVFLLIGLVQLVRVLSGWTVTVGDTTMPLWPSWVAFIVATALAWMGFVAARH